MLCVLRLSECDHNGNVGYPRQSTGADRASHHDGATSGERERARNAQWNHKSKNFMTSMKNVMRVL